MGYLITLKWAYCGLVRLAFLSGQNSKLDDFSVRHFQKLFIVLHGVHVYMCISLYIAINIHVIVEDD